MLLKVNIIRKKNKHFNLFKKCIIFIWKSTFYQNFLDIFRKLRTQTFLLTNYALLSLTKKKKNKIIRREN